MDGVWPWNIGDTWKVYSDAAFGMNAFDQIDKFIKDLKRIRAKLGFHQQRVSSHAATSAADAPRPEAHSQSPSNSGVGASREVPGVVGRATECGTQATAAERRGEPRANVSKGMSWQDVRGRLLAQLESKAKAASMQDWAESIGCSVSTVQKAIRRTPCTSCLVEAEVTCATGAEHK